MNDVWNKLEANAYRNKNPYPEKPKKPYLNRDSGPDGFRAHADALEIYDNRMKIFREEVAHYNAISASLENDFRNDLEEYFGVTTNPKKDILYWKAYQHGHSSGLHEIANVYSDLVELIQ